MIYTLYAYGKAARSLDVREARVPEDRVALDQLADPALEAPLGLEPGGAEALVRHDVVALVRVLADRRLEVDEARHELLDRLAELELGEVRFIQADVVGLAPHGVEVLEAMQE